ncbi:MAG TPA: AAA family ATPase [Micromonosporaceae bacterium]|nr:AAA family ATPase [Micromonosporaceae bacterium]
MLVALAMGRDEAALAHSIVGRTEERAVLDRFLGDAMAEPRVLLIEGEAGIGKSILLDDLLETAAQHGTVVLACRPSHSEMDLSYVGLIELLAGLADEVIEALPGPQAKVIRMILRQEEPDGQFDRLSLYLAVAAAIRSVAALGPVLIAIDDAQWLDHPSARTLVFVVRRLAGTASRIAIVRRTGEATDWIGDLTREVHDDQVDEVRLTALGPRDLSRVFRRALGWVPAWPRTVRIAELSGGNPLHALELARAVGSVRESVDLDGSLPDSVVELARSRIAKLAPQVRSALEIAAIPHAPTLDLLRQLDSMAIGLDAALSKAEHQGIVTIDGGRVRFAHPILAAAVYGSIPAPRRQQLHRAVATLSADMEERAQHLARATEDPDPEVARALAEAAEVAWRRGAPTAAADLLRLACLRTPHDQADTLALRRIAYGRILYTAGDSTGAIAELQSLVVTSPAAVVRARALYHLMYITRVSGQLGTAIDYGLRAATEAAGDPAFQAEVYALLSRISSNNIERKLDAARKGIEAIERVRKPDPYVLFHAHATLVEAEFYAGLGTHLERLDGLPPPAGARFPPVRTAMAREDLVGRLLIYDGRVDEGLRVLHGMYDRAVVEDISLAPVILGWMAEAEIMAGRFHRALELTREAIEHSEHIGGNEGNPWEVGLHGVALALLGRLDQAEAVAARVVTRAGADRVMDLDEATAHLALGIVALSRGEFASAVEYLRPVDRVKRDAGVHEPRLCAHAGELIEALVGAGELGEAAEVLARLESDAASSAGQWSLVVAARCRAILHAAQGRLDEALASARKAQSLADGLPMPLEHGRTLLVAGQIHRRRREKLLARHALTAALEVFDGLPAPVWAQRARAELARIPVRRSDDSLTPTEATIARLVVGDQSRDRRPRLRQPEDGRSEPHTHLSQTRRALAGSTGEPVGGLGGPTRDP